MQNLLTKRNIIIAVIIIILAFGALFYFGRKNAGTGTMPGFIQTLFPISQENPKTGGAPVGAGTSTLPGAGTVTPTGQLPQTEAEAGKLLAGTLLQLSRDNIASIALLSTTTVRYHKNIPENIGHLFERRPDGSGDEIRIANFTIPKIIKVVWAPDSKKSIIFYDLDGTAKKILINYISTSTPKTNFLPDSLSDAVFSPDSKSIAFINDLGGSHNIFTETTDLKNQKKITDNDIPGLELSWPGASFLALKTKSSYVSRGYLYTLDIKTGALKKVAEGPGLDAVWSADGSSFIYSLSNMSGSILPIKFVDVKTGAEQEISSVKTIAEKCVFARSVKKAAYCAVPQNTEASSHYPDDWWSGKISFEDIFVAIDLANNLSSFFVPTQNDIINPKILSDDSYLMFKDKITGALWSLKLKP